MAATNINNLDGLDVVADIGATEEAKLKACVKGAVSNTTHDGFRLVDLFIGQMSAEGFDLSAGDGTGIRAYVQSPTVKIEHLVRDGGREYIKSYIDPAGGGTFTEAELHGEGPLPNFLDPTPVPVGG